MQPRPPSARLRAVLLLAVLLVLAACSASGSSPASSSAPSPPTSVDSPAAAARLVAERSPLFAGIEAKDPDMIGQGSWWEAKPIAGGGYRVTFRVGWGDCPAGCIDEHTWTWDVATDGRTTFVEEAGPELPPAVVAQLRAAATGHTGVAGRVTAGPACPVETPDNPCADRAVAGAVLVVQGVGGAEVARVTTDAAGLFRVELQPGDYTLAPQPVEGLMGTASPQPFSVTDGSETFLDVAYDTGIR